MALVILVLLGQAAWQGMRISGLKAEVDQARRELNTRVERMALEKLQERREDLVAAVAFVDDFYRSPEGLQRPEACGIAEAQEGRCRGDRHLGPRCLPARRALPGPSDAEARQTIADNIKGSDEWRRKHPAR